MICSGTQTRTAQQNQVLSVDPPYCRQTASFLVISTTKRRPTRGALTNKPIDSTCMSAYPPLPLPFFEVMPQDPTLCMSTLPQQGTTSIARNSRINAVRERQKKNARHNGGKARAQGPLSHQSIAVARGPTCTMSPREYPLAVVSFKMPSNASWEKETTTQAPRPPSC